MNVKQNPCPQHMVQQPTESLNKQFREGTLSVPLGGGQVFPHIDIENSDLNVSREKINLV